MTLSEEDDLRHSFFHTVSVERLEAGLDPASKPVAWLRGATAPSITSIFMPDSKQERASELDMGIVDLPFVIPNVRAENPQAAAHTRIGWFRSVSNILHAFAVQSFVAALAATVGRNPKDYLLELIGPDRLAHGDRWVGMWNYGEDPVLHPFDTGRLRRVVARYHPHRAFVDFRSVFAALWSNCHQGLAVCSSRCLEQTANNMIHLGLCGG